MKKLSRKAKNYLKKCQQGGMPYIDPVESFDWEIWASANDMNDAAQPPFLPQSMSNSTQPMEQAQNPQSKEFKGSDFLNLVPGIGKIALGVGSLINSQREKREAKSLRKIFDMDNKRRMEEQRANNFYATPYTTGRTSNYGPSRSFQQGGMTLPDQVDYFVDMYQQREQNQNNKNRMIFDFYNQQVANKKQQSKESLQSGLSNVASGLMQGLSLFQSGGLTKEELRQDKIRDTRIRNTKNNKTDAKTNPNTTPNFFLNKDDSSRSKSKDRFRQQEGGVIEGSDDLYSPNFVSPWQDTSQDSVQSSDPFESWIFSDDEPIRDYSVNDLYFKSNRSDSGSILDEIGKKESGNNYSAVNPNGGATGKYQFMPRYWAGPIREFMNLPSSGSNSSVMEKFKNSPETQEDFMSHVYKNIYLPEVEKLRPLASKYGFTDNQIVKMLHYRGLADTKRRLQTGDFKVSDSEKKKYNNPDILNYIR